MVMDPLSALSLAATIVQLVDFTSKIVSKGYHIYNTTDTALPENAALEYIVTHLQNLNARLKHHNRLSCATKDKQALEDLSTNCTMVANEVVSRLNKLKVANNAKHRKWKSFRQALKSVWSKEELDGYGYHTIQIPQSIRVPYFTVTKVRLSQFILS